MKRTLVQNPQLRRRRWSGRRLWLAAVAMMLAACGGPSADAPVSRSETLSDSENCDDAAANKTFTGFLPLEGFTTTSSYGSSDCGSAYLVNLNAIRYVPSEADRVTYGEAAPTTSAECQRLRLGAYLWRRYEDGTTRLKGAVWRWASWGNNFCVLPSIDLKTDLTIDTVGDYRIAVTARRHVTARDASSDFVKRKVKLYRDTSSALDELKGTAECWKNLVNFTERTGYKSKPIAEYRLYRKAGSGSFAHIQSELAGTVSTFADRQIEPAVGVRHTYYVSAINTSGETTRSPELALTNTAALCAAPAQKSIRVLLAACGTSTVTRADIRRKLFSTTNGALSVANYVKEASYAKMSFLEDSTTNWLPVPSDIDCTEAWDPVDDVWTGTYTEELLDWAEEQIKASHENDGKPEAWMLVVANALRSESGYLKDGVPMFVVGGTHFTPSYGSSWFGGTVHEFGHLLGFHHHSSTKCPGNTQIFPTGPNLPSGCDAAAYDGSDPMGSGVKHYNGLAKLVLGWIPRDDLVSKSIDPNTRTFLTVPISDLNSSSGDRVIELRYATGDRFYVDYRRPIGFNDMSQFDPNEPPLIEGLYVYYAPRARLNCSTMLEPCLTGSYDAALFAPASGFLTYVDPENPMTEPSRRLRISMRAGTNGTASAVIESGI